MEEVFSLLCGFLYSKGRTSHHFLVLFFSNIFLFFDLKKKKYELGTMLGFRNLSGRNRITSIVVLLWWVMGEGWSFGRINGVRMNSCVFHSLLYMP